MNVDESKAVPLPGDVSINQEPKMALEHFVVLDLQGTPFGA